MKDYRLYGTLYKRIGFFLLILGTLVLSMKATAWAMYIGKCVS